MIDLVQKEKEILSSLKDFQNATVERVYHLFTNDFTRVLVADEVGLGKTMIAKGVIAKMARFHQIDLQDPLYKVVYVCSNQDIAGQNLKKLKIDPKVTLDGLSDTRLSMQHLKIFENDFDPEIQENYIHLIPLTPATSFDMTSGCGSAKERALIFAILKRYEPLQPYLVELEIVMMDQATSSWDSIKQKFEERVLVCNEKSGGEYLKTILGRVGIHFKNRPSLLNSIADICRLIQEKGKPGHRVEGANNVIYQLRRMMAEISVDLLDADLVIMDEFQRFSKLIKTDEKSETALLAKKFFNSPKANEDKVKILLLSATPYKLYSTLEEMSEAGNDEHYQEFMEVTDFLFEHHEAHKQKFKKVWNNYSIALSQIHVQDFAMLVAKKQEAEDSLYKGIARTERILAEGEGQFSDTVVYKAPLIITEEDVLSYIAMDKLLQVAELKEKVPADYVKSAPFLMSYMERYKIKQKITQYFRKNHDKITLARNKLLWINEREVSKYKRLPDTNARFTQLKEIALPKNAEKLMWIPPSLPYYEFGGCFSGMSRFSKILVFSAWEMVPRAIATLLSYEAERLTVGELIKKYPSKKKDRNRSYFAKARFPSPRLNFAMRDHTPANMNHLTLLYPSMTLVKLFNPAGVLNKQLTLEEIKDEIREKIQRLLAVIDYERKEDDFRQDDRWYFLAPLLFDRKEAAIQEWFQSSTLLLRQHEGKDSKHEDPRALVKHFEELQELFLHEDPPVLGKQPEDLVDVLVDITLGSPAVCASRMLQGNVKAEAIPYCIQLGKTILDRFNSQEATSIIELQYGRELPHWKSVLKYCVDGNFQAMLDEYAHMLLEEGGMREMEENERNKRLLSVMSNALKTHAAFYNVDTFNYFKKRIFAEGKKVNSRRDLSMKMRTHYAVGFYETSHEESQQQRKENVRLAFNSPFRPFVLASTSIGQEGLDFHYYCRRIMHWNLPSNPIDLEQREGRINRYKGLMIRQNIASKYGHIPFEKDIWQEMFSAANQMEKSEQTSELVPFWSLPGDANVKMERYVSIYPLSRDGVKYERLMKILALYRLSLGQARQEELLDYVFQHDLDEKRFKELFMNLSPYYKEKAKKGEVLLKD